MSQADPELRRKWVSWSLLATLAVLCLALAVLQYRSLREVSEAESFRRRQALESALTAAANQFDGVLTRGARAVVRDGFQAPPEEREMLHAGGYLRWKQTGAYPNLFSRICRVLPDGTLRQLDGTGTFQAAEWPAEWAEIRATLDERIATGRMFGPIAGNTGTVIEIPRFGGRGGPPGEREDEPRGPEEWMLLEVDLAVAKKELLPQVLNSQLSARGVQDYEIEIRSAVGETGTVFRTGTPIGDSRSADAAVRMFNVRYDDIRGSRRGPPGEEARPRMEEKRGGGGRMRASGGRWEMLARHKSGSLDAAVGRAHARNAALTGAILALILGGSFALVRFNRNAQRLAELQVQFISGVSHELRTPLSVIASAAFNLERGVVKDPAQMKTYGGMIRSEAERLTAIVEQVLRFARTRSGSALSSREPVQPGEVVEEAVQAAARAVQESGCVVEKAIEPELPPIAGDPLALKQAVQNLIANAAKYGWEGGWIGIYALRVTDAKNREFVEIRVADRGPGIPHNEIGQIFAPFFRGRRAVDDQVHGTGLGLDLAKKIVEAHEGTITARSEAGRLTEFVIRIPAIPVEQRDEFANIAD
jgi:signal transduction histidine kinase